MIETDCLDTIPDEHEVARPPLATVPALFAPAAALALAACGGGGGAGGSPGETAATVTPAAAAPAITRAQASRFLTQASMGATAASITAVVQRGYDGWLTDQFATARETSHWDWLIANGYGEPTQIGSQSGFDPSVWRQLIAAPDQLRQRVGMALLDILVVGIDGLGLNWKPCATGAYLDILLDNAFGNYRTLLEGVTLNAAMASFLTYLGNRKANPATGAQPDENYARELMQLFTLGLHRLNMDGSVQTAASGAPLETYTPEDVSGLARVFTGLSLVNGDNSNPSRLRVPLVMNASLNETGSASFLGTTVSGGGLAAVRTALDTIFAHPNLPPFVSKGLIQRLVTSNPSPAYIGRVAAVFANNGSGVRGDLKSVVRAILIDADARSDAALTTASAGRLRDPVLRLTGWARAFGVTSPSDAWAIGDTSPQATRLGQSPGRAPSVFGFFRPGYTPPAAAMAQQGMVAPELQITNDVSVIGYVNYMQALVANGTGDVKANYDAILTKASDSAALVDEVNILLAAGQLSAATVTAIRGAVDSIAVGTAAGPLNRVGVAILLTLASPDYLTFR